MKLKMILCSLLGVTVVSLIFGQTATINKAAFPSSNNQVETTIAINPTDPNNLVAGAIIITPNLQNHLAFYYSSDGGNTWNGNENFPSAGSGAADPVVAFDRDGVAYYVYQIRDQRKLFLHKSSDGGQTWSSNPTTVVSKTSPKNVDKPWMAISPAKNANNQYDIYVGYTETEDLPGTGKTIWQATSSDGGITFTTFEIGSEVELEGGAAVAFGPNGNAYIGWGRFDSTVPFPQTAIKFSFTSSTVSVTQIGTAKKIGGKWFFVLKNSEVKVNSFPSIDVDRTEGPNRGAIYLVWADQRFGDPDILLSKSSDNGATWSAPIRVNTDTQGNGKDQWFPSVSVDPDGIVNVIFYDSRSSSDVCIRPTPSWHWFEKTLRLGMGGNRSFPILR